MLRATGRRENATEAVRLQDSRDLQHCFPKKFRVLEGLSADDHVSTGRGYFCPVVRIAQKKRDFAVNFASVGGVETSEVAPLGGPAHVVRPIKKDWTFTN